MRRIESYCPFCKTETKQQANLESYLSCSGYIIFIEYWTRCNECGNNLLNLTKEINVRRFINEN